MPRFQGIPVDDVQAPQPAAPRTGGRFGGILVEDAAPMANAAPKNFSGVSARIDSTAAPAVSYPEGATLEEINAQNRAYMASPQRQADEQRQNEWQAQQRQEAFRELPAPARALIGAGSRVGNLAMGAGQLLGVTDEADVAAQRENDRFMEGDLAAGAGKIGGDVAMLLAPGRAIGGLGSLTSRVAANVGLGAGVGALEPIVEGESRGVNALVGGALGGAGELAGTGLRALAKGVSEAVSAPARELFQAAKERGIRLTPAQLTDSGFLQALSRLPLSGAASRYAKQRAAWNRAVARVIGEDADAVTPEVYSRAKERQSALFNELTERNNLKVDDGLLRRLGNIAESSKVAGRAISEQVESAIDALYQQAAVTRQGVQIPGRAYQAFDSAMGKLTKGGDTAAHYIGEVRDAVRAAMDDSINAADSALWKNLRREYRDRKTLTDLVAKSDFGDLNPASLMARITASKASKEMIATGKGGELGMLARIGRRLKEPKPPSGEEGNRVRDAVNPIQWPGLALGSAVGVTAGRVPQSQVLANYLVAPGAGNGLARLAQMTPSASIGLAPVVSGSVVPGRVERPAK